MLDTHARRFIQPAFEQAAKGFIKLGFKANQVTWLAFLVALPVGILIYQGSSWLPVLLLWTSGALDAIDGSIARRLGQASPWGTLLDITFDRLVELSVIIGLAARYPQTQFLLLLLTAGIVFSMTVFLTVGALSEKQSNKSFYYQAGLAERTEGFILLTLMILFPKHLDWLTGFFLATVLITAIQRMVEARKILR